MTDRRMILVALALAAALVASPAPASAAAASDFLFDPDRVSDDRQFFLNLAVGDYGYGRPVLEPVLPRLHHLDDDLPVVLFLARESGRPVDAIVDLRARGLGWPAIFHEVGVPVDALFVGVDADPGPPYGRAWGYWKKKVKKPKGVWLTDTDVVGLVKVQMASHWTGMSPYEVARARGRGVRVVTLVAEKKGRPYKGKGHEQGKTKKGKAKAKGHGY